MPKVKPASRQARPATKRTRRARGEGSVIYHKNTGLWEARVDLGRDPVTKKRSRRSFYRSTYDEAARAITDEKVRSGGTIRARATGTVGEWVSEWLASVKLSRSAATFSDYSGTWNRHIEDRIGSIALEKFDIEHVTRMFAALDASGVSASMQRRIGTTMHRAFAVAIRMRRYHKANPFGIVERPTHRPREGRALKPHEALLLLDAARGDRLEALFVTLLTCGLRLGEALALEWDDVDFETRTLSVRRSLIEVPGTFEVGETKTPKSRRRVDLGALALAALKRRYRAWQKEDHTSELVFSTLNGQPMRRSNVVRSHYKPILTRANIGHVTLHDLRHSMGSLAVAQGIPVKTISDRLGHSTTRLTEDRYLHALPGLQRKAATAIDRALQPGKRRKK